MASVSNRVIARIRAEAKKRLKGEGEGFLRSPPPPPSFIFLCSCPIFLDEPREETLAMQAKGYGKNTRLFSEGGKNPELTIPVRGGGGGGGDWVGNFEGRG